MNDAPRSARLKRFSSTRSLLAGALAALAAFSVAAPGAAQLKIYVLDIGQGDSVLVVAPNKTAMLVDAAKTGMGATGTPTDIVSFINGKISGGEITNFKCVVSTHYDADHIGGMGGTDGVINHVTDTPETAYDRGGSAGTIQYNDYINAIAEKGVARETLAVGEIITLDQDAGVTVTCVAANGYVLGHGYISGAADENELSIVLLLTYGGFDYLFEGDVTGGLVSGESDIETPAGEAIKNTLRRGVDICQAAHHGSHTGSNTDFLTLIRPENVIISVGNTNPFLHPRQEALNRIESFPRVLPDRPDLRPDDGTGVLNIYQTSEGLGGTSDSVITAGTTDTEGILVTCPNGINYTVQSLNGSHIPATSFIADDVNAPNDIDGDGLRDATEDKDRDGVVDGDTNGNGIVDPGEAFSETNPRTADTDADGIPDGVEDCGSDGVPNISELGFNPSSNPDPNGDDYNRTSNPSGTEGNAAVDDWPERTESTVADTDGDGLKDGQEDTNANGRIEGDLDNDGVWDVGETWTETSPVDSDTDNDGANDGSDAFPLDPAEQLDTDGDGVGNNADTDDDDDGLLDANESAYGCNPLLADTDGDGALDGFEVDNGFDPTNASSYPKVVINEVFWNPSGDDDGKEFVELYNPQKAAIDVSGFIIQCGYTTTFYDNVSIPDGTVIPSNGYYLIAESESVTDKNGYPPDLIADLELQQAGDGNSDGVRLVSPTKTTVFDCILYGSSTHTLPTAGAYAGTGLVNAPEGSSIGRVVPGVDNDLLRDFIQLSAPNPTSSQSHPHYPGVNVKINEVCYEPAGDDTVNEWIELYNPDDRTVDIGGFRIQSGGGSFVNNGDALPANTYMFPKSFFLIGWSGASPAPDYTLLSRGSAGDFQNGDQYTYYSGEWHYSPSPTDGVRIILPKSEDTATNIAVDTLLYDEPNDNSLPGDSVSQNLIPDEDGTPGSDPGFSLSRAVAGVDTNDTSGTAPYYDWVLLSAANMTPTNQDTDNDEDGVAALYDPNDADDDSDGDTILDGTEDANQNGDYDPNGTIFNEVLAGGVVAYYAYHTPKETKADDADTDDDDLRDDFEIDGGLDPRSSESPYEKDDDPDGDGLTNYQEYLGKDGNAPAAGIESFDYPSSDSTYPMNPDSDGDGMPDGWEVLNDLNPLDPADASQDPDGDLLSNLAEYVNGTDIRDNDSDDDGLRDYFEVSGSLDPLDPDGENGPDGDPDDDDLSNGMEATEHTKPLVADTDGDGLNDGAEYYTYGTDPTNPDHDEDGMPDGWEVAYALDPKSTSGNDGASGDPDGDGLLNLNEYNGGNNSTDPHNPDCDADGMKDGWDYTYLDANNASGDNGPDGDPDGDDLKNLAEYLGVDGVPPGVTDDSTNPNDDDSDNDGFSDHDEILSYGSDPNNLNSPPYAQANEVLVNEFFANPLEGSVASDADGNGVGSGSATGDADEFIEFVNVSDHAVRLDGYRVTDSTSWATYDKQFATGTVLAAGEAIVLFDDNAEPTSTVGYFGYAQVVIADNDLGLNNSSGDVIKLWGSSGTIVVDDAQNCPGSSSGISKILNPELSAGHSWTNHPLLSAKYFSPGRYKTGAAFGDLDGDGLPNSVDTDDDADGVTDVWELYFGTNPRVDDNELLPDTDEDGLPDGDLANSESWMDEDDDNDRISDEEEIGYDGDSSYSPYPAGTDMDKAKTDTDGDGYSDFMEFMFNGSPVDPDGGPHGPIQVNFQPVSFTSAQAYAWDTAQAFSAEINYGWTAP